MRKRNGVKVVIVSLGIASLTGCYATISTPSGLREHHRGLNGGLSVAKSKNDQKEEYHQTQRETDYNALNSLAARMAAEAGS